MWKTLTKPIDERDGYGCNQSGVELEIFLPKTGDGALQLMILRFSGSRHKLGGEGNRKYKNGI